MSALCQRAASPLPEARRLSWAGVCFDPIPEGLALLPESFHRAQALAHGLGRGPGLERVADGVKGNLVAVAVDQGGQGWVHDPRQRVGKPQTAEHRRRPLKDEPVRAFRIEAFVIPEGTNI